jgi:hypothetical protein
MFVLTAMAFAGQLGLSQNGYHPGAKEVAFDPDWQLFAPVQLQDMEDIPARKRANTGFYVTYDRMYMMVTRPEAEQATNALDTAWGNRWDFGWSREDGGWNFSVMNIDGPDKYNRYGQRWASYPLPDIDGDDGDAILQAPETLLQQYRTFEMLDSVNAGSMRGFEANKTWRFEPYRYGGILEPMIGLRYAGFQDLAVNTRYTVDFGTVTNQFGDDISQEQYTKETARIDNNMLLGQFGFRYTKAVRRWTFSNDAKVFAGHVYQNREFSTDVFNNYFGATIGAGDDPIQELDRDGTTFTSSRRDNSTVGFDIRVEAAYKAFKGVDLRAGFQMLYFGRGIWRGATPLGGGNQFANNQHLIMPGFTAGLTWNR